MIGLLGPPQDLQYFGIYHDSQCPNIPFVIACFLAFSDELKQPCLGRAGRLQEVQHIPAGS